MSCHSLYMKSRIECENHVIRTGVWDPATCPSLDPRKNNDRTTIFWEEKSKHLAATFGSYVRKETRVNSGSF